MERRAASNAFASVVRTSRLAVLTSCRLPPRGAIVTQYILRRLIQSLFIIWGCATLVFFMLRMIPGDPVVQMLGPEYTPEAAAALRDKLGLDQPLHIQYVRWFGNVLTGDLGGSIASGETVSGAIATGLPKTLSLAALSFLIALVIAVPAGIIAALRRNSGFRLCGQHRRLHRRQHAELLVRHHADPHLRRAVALAAGHRLLRDRRRMASWHGWSD